MLMKLAVDTSLGPEALAAAVQLKNLLMDSYDLESELAKQLTLIQQEDKDFIKTNIFKAMITSSKSIALQLNVCFTLLGKKEFPDIWPFFLSQIKEVIETTKDLNELQHTLYAFKSLMKILKIKDTPIEIPLIDELFANSLYGLASQLLKVKEARLLSNITSAFYSYTYDTMTDDMIKYFDKWMTIFQEAFILPYEAGNEDAFSKLKTSVSDIFFSIFNRYGNPRGNTGSHIEFRKYVQTKYTLPIFNFYLNLLKLTHLPPKLIGVTFRLMSLSIYNPITEELIKPLLFDIATKAAFPYLFMTSYDEEQHIQLILDENLIEFSPKASACHFIHSACMYNKNSMLIPFISFLMNTIQVSVKEGKPLGFDACLCCMGLLKDLIKEVLQARECIEFVMHSFVLPGLSDSIVLIKLRCCWFINRFASVEFGNREVYCDKLLSCITDSNISVRVASSIAISKLAKEASIRERLKPRILALISSFLNLMAQTECYKLVAALERVIRSFGDVIIPYSEELIRKLVKAYEVMEERRIEEAEKKDDEDACIEITLSSVNCVEAIMRVIGIIGDYQEILTIIEPLILNLAKTSLIPERLHVLESTIELISCFTFHKVNLNSEIWEVYTLLIDVTVGLSENSKSGNWGMTALDLAVVTLSNCIVKDPITFINSKYDELTIYFIKKIPKINTKYEYDKIPAMKMIIAILEGLKVTLVLTHRIKLIQYLNKY